jgi:hypothetical protein
MPTAPPFIMGLIREVSQRLEVFDDLSGLITVLIALFKRFGVLLKLNARLTAIRVFDASLERQIQTRILRVCLGNFFSRTMTYLAALLRVPEAKSPVSISS